MNQKIRFTMKIAGVCIRAAVSYERTFELCRKYVCPDTDAAEEAVFSVEVSEDDIAFEMERYAQEYGQRDDYLPALFEDISLYRKITERMLNLNVILIHGSAVAVDDAAYLFIAPSGTGKSTHARLWREHFGTRACMVNDDKPLLRLEENRVFVCGTPFSGKHHLDTDIQVPLKGIVYLEQADENELQKLNAEEAFSYVFKQAYRPRTKGQMTVTLDLLERLTALVPVYRMNMNNFKGDAVTAACSALNVAY